MPSGYGWSPHARHRSAFCPATKHAGLFLSVSPERACGTPGGSPRPWRHVLWTHGSVHLAGARWCVPLRITRSLASLHRLDQDGLGNRNTLRSAKRRFYQLATPSSASAGALTKCGHRHIAGSLGRPPSHIGTSLLPLEGRHTRRSVASAPRRDVPRRPLTGAECRGYSPSDCGRQSA